MATPQLPEYIEISKYANHVESLSRRELWPEMIERVFGMHDEFYGDKLDAIRPLVDKTQEMMLHKKALGSQRVLQFGGAPVLKHHAKVYNCTVSFADRPRFFQECFYLLLCGCGTGFSVQKHHVAKMPALAKRHVGRTKTFVIPDSIEGWADALGVLVSSYLSGDVPFPEYQGWDVEFDASQVRPKGAPISSGSKAPGPEPLLLALERAADVMSRVYFDGLSHLAPIDVYDVIMHISDAVLSGGVRRSASIAMFSHDDLEMATAKTGNWYLDNPQRQRSNNSVVLVRDQTTYPQFRDLIELTKQFGEPGFVWTDSTEMVVNPCVEIGMWPVWVQPDGTEVSGWQMCNLSTINGAQCTTPGAFYEACRAAATMGTLQAGYASFPYLGEITEKIVAREALIGVSITGMMEQPDILFDPAVLSTGAAIVKATNAVVADAIGTNHAARATCLKPEGTSSCMLDTCSGIHTYHSRRGVRHVQANVLEPPFQHFKAANPHAVFPLSNGNESTEVIAFPYTTDPQALTKADVDAMNLLSRVISVRKHWVEPGTRPELCTQPWLRHNVSNTIHVQADEWETVAQFIYDQREHFAGVALLSALGDKVYEQAPFVAVLTPEEQEALYGVAAVAAALRLASAVPPTELSSLWAACSDTTALDADSAFGHRMNDTWSGRMLKLARGHFDGELDRAVHCVKDAWLYGYWRTLIDNMTTVDWEALHEAEDTVNFGAESACAGGSCEIVYT